MKFNLKDWSKIQDHKDYAVLRSKDGHELKIGKKALSEKMRSDLEALEIKGKSDEKPIKMNQGGKVPAKKSAGDLDKKAAEEFSRGARQSGWRPAEWGKNLKAAVAQTFKDGGVVKALEDLSDEDEVVQIGGGIPESLAQSETPWLDKPVQIPQQFIPAEQPFTGVAIPGLEGLPQASESLPTNEINYSNLEAPRPPNGVSGEWEAPEPSSQPIPEVPVAAPAPIMEAPVMPEASKAPQQPSGMALIEQGLRNEAKAIQMANDAQAAVLAQKAKDVQDAYKVYEQNVAKIDAERQELIKQMPKIDPDRLWSNSDSASKAASVIGLIIGGIGGGILGRENAAQTMLTRLIDNDLEAQKKNLDTQQNLLSFNTKQLGNLKDGMDMTRIMLNDVASARLAEAAAKANNPLAKARLQKELGQLQATQAALTQQMAARQQGQQIIQMAKKDPSKIPAAIDALEATNPKAAEDMRKRFVPGLGLASSYEEGKELRELKTNTESAKMGIKELLKINKSTGKSLSLEDRAKAQTISQTLVGLLRVPITGPGAMNEGERELLENLVANPTRIFSLDNSTKVKLQTLESQLETKLALAARARGIDAALPLSQEEKAAQYEAWARANPNDPRAQKILSLKK